MWCIPSEGREDSTLLGETLFLSTDDLMVRDNMQFQIVVSVGAMFTVRTGETSQATIVVGLDMGGKVGVPREGTGAEGT